MKAFKNIVIALVGFGLPFSASYGQTPVGIGQWRIHYPYTGTSQLAKANKKLYAANKSSLYYYDTEDKSLNFISKKDGLSGVDINELGDYKSQVLLIGYADGNIDFVTNQSIQQFDDIQRSNIIGSKSINKFYTLGSKVYVCTDYGLSIIDMTRKEVVDSYINISSDGSSNPFYAMVLSQDGDSIFVASQKGLMAAKFSPGVNLRDYSNWKMYGLANGMPTGDKRAVGRLGSVILAGSNGSGVYYFDGVQWQSTGITGAMIRHISSGDTYSISCVDNKVYKSTSVSEHQAYQTSYLPSPDNSFADEDKIWITEPGIGISYYVNGNPSVSIINLGYPQGPITQDTYRMKYIDNKVVNCRGGLTVSWGNVYKEAAVMFLGSDDQWTSQTFYTGIPSQVRDLLDAALHPSGKWYFATYGWGLLQWDTHTFKLMTPADSVNSPLKSYFTSGLTTAKDGTVWVCAPVNASDNIPCLYAIAPNGKWYGFKAHENNGNLPQEIVIDNQNNKWVRFGGSGGIRGLMWLKELNRAGGVSQQIYFGIKDDNGGLPSINVNTMDVDKTGQVWVGTDAGIAIFTNPAQLGSGAVPKAYLPIVSGFPLFFDKKINCIKTDGANRKWVGTPDGVFLLSADGLETVHHFNKTNSPMIDNYVSTITINEVTGEVFFGTDKGIISYRSDATAGEETHNNVKVFPNPIERDFDGYVGISGLANNARVKITDAAGRLTYETPAYGGTASWNLKDYTGRRATAGIYLIFSASDDGSERFVGKMAILD